MGKSRAKPAIADGTVGKALNVMDLAASHGRPVRFTTLLAESPYPKATLYRLLQTLTNQGMLSFDPERQTYTPGLRLVRLAHAAWRQSSLAPIARPQLEALSNTLDQTIHLAQLDNGQVLYVDKINARQSIEMFSQAGKVGPAYCTGVGKAMLAHLDAPELDTALKRQSFHRFTAHTLTDPAALLAELAHTRERGFACDDEEHEPGIICIAVPILSSSGRVIGAMSVTGSTARTDLAALARTEPKLRQAAAAIAEAAENWRFPEQRKGGNGCPA